ncbi:MAG TPA: UbiA family prenyltransferase, partial [Candidatus Binataceae bacterium]|nr:UbiA family prenyltransferase [Candidatus Binataceae bacterium]
GAIPGALPPVAGWAAARGEISCLPLLMFSIMFLWQLPHTFAVARLYRNDYRRAGIHLLPDDRADGGNPSNAVVIAACLGLVAAGMAPTALGQAGLVSASIGALCGAAMLVSGAAMVLQPARAQAARRLLFSSLFYLPIVLLALVLDRV